MIADRHEAGHALAVLLVSIAVMGILMSAAMPVWKTAIQREREEELVFRGEQYARAVGLFQRKFAGAFPPSIDLLVEQKFLRRKYKDPITNGDFQVLYANTATQPGQQPGVGTSRGATRPGPVPARPGQTDTAFPAPQGSPFGGASALAGPRGGMVGVVSKSTDKSFRLYKGRGRYNEWQFVYTAVSTGAGVPGGPGRGGQRPGQPQPGMPGQMGPGGMRPGGSSPFPGRPPQGPIPPRQPIPQ